MKTRFSSNYHSNFLKMPFLDVVFSFFISCIYLFLPVTLLFFTDKEQQWPITGRFWLCGGSIKLPVIGVGDVHKTIRGNGV